MCDIVYMPFYIIMTKREKEEQFRQNIFETYYRNLALNITDDIEIGDYICSVNSENEIVFKGYKCHNKVNGIKVPNIFDVIGSYCLSDNYKLENVIFGDRIKRIEHSAFRDYSGRIDLTGCHHLSHISSYAFYGFRHQQIEINTLEPLLVEDSIFEDYGNYLKTISINAESLNIRVGAFSHYNTLCFFNGHYVSSHFVGESRRDWLYFERKGILEYKCVVRKDGLY